MADNVPITQGTGTDIATDQVAGTLEHIQLFKLAYSADGVRTLVACDADGLTVQSPTAAKFLVTEANSATRLSESDFDTKAGSITETAPATDTASSGLNGRLQRIAQRFTSLIALLPAALTGSGNLKVSLAESTATQAVSGPLTDTQLRANAVPVTANAGTNLNTSALALESGGNLAAIKADVDKIPSQGQAVAGSSMPVVLPAAQITTLTPPAAITGFALEATQLTGNTSVASVKTNTDPLVAAGGGGYVRQDSTATIAKESGGNLAAIATSEASIDGKLPTLASSLPATSASAVPVRAVREERSSGDTALGSMNAAATAELTGFQSAGGRIDAGTLAGTITFEKSGDGGATWGAQVVVLDTTGAQVLSVALTNPNGAVGFNYLLTGQVTHIRARVSSYTSGTATGRVRASAVIDSTALGGANGPNGAAAPLSATLIAGADGGGTQRRVTVMNSAPAGTEYAQVIREVNAAAILITTTTIAGAIKAEDAASADGASGIAALTVRQDIPTTDTSASGDYGFVKADANGRVWIASDVLGVQLDRIAMLLELSVTEMRVQNELLANGLNIRDPLDTLRNDAAFIGPVN